MATQEVSPHPSGPAITSAVRRLLAILGVVVFLYGSAAADERVQDFKKNLSAWVGLAQLEDQRIDMSYWNSILALADPELLKMLETRRKQLLGPAYWPEPGPPKEDELNAVDAYRFAKNLATIDEIYYKKPWQITDRIDRYIMTTSSDEQLAAFLKWRPCRE